jgi:c-di-GMP-binding flagellar brake protein YcgR
MAEQYSEVITEDKMVITALQSLIEVRTVCTMEIPRTKHSWITMLLEVEKIDHSYYLSIDKVSEFESTLSRYPDREVSLEFMDEAGVPCQFNTKVVAVRSKDILSELPEAIYRIQRRRYFRIDALLGTEITYRIGPSEEREKEKVKNFSGGGVAFILGKALKFGVGDLLNDLHLTVPAGTGRIDFHIPHAAVRRIEERSYYAGEKTLCAIEFLEISKETRDRLTFHIFKQERVMMQKLRR